MVFITLLSVLASLLVSSSSSSLQRSVVVSFDSSLVSSSDDVVGRLLVYLVPTHNLKTYEQQPRTLFQDQQDTAQAFGMDVHINQHTQFVRIDRHVFGFPIESIDRINAGEYLVQAQLLKYREYKRREYNRTILLPESCINPSGQNGAYDSPQGTLFSKPQVEYLKRNGEQEIRVHVDQAIVQGNVPNCSGNGRENSEFIKTVRMKSKLLSEFWSEPITLEACVLLPYGWNEHPNVKYPLVIAHGHYSSQWAAPVTFEESPPENFDPENYDSVAKLYGHYFYKNWTSFDGDFKRSRMIVVTLNHPVPIFDDSYAVNSAFLGPYGDAINFELIPEIEKQFRGIGQGWARGLFGGSTGGWESLATQVFYPDEFNGVYAFCPDPVTFSSFTTINIYNDDNAFYYNSAFKRTEKPGTRDQYSGRLIGYGIPFDRTMATVRDMNLRELVLGDKSRSCGQFDIWEAVFGPVGKDGYPARIFDKKTGVLDKSVAKYWKENYDLKEILARNWTSLGPKLLSKLHIYVGAMDTYFLNNAVMELQDFLESTKNPESDADIVIGTHFGRGFEHCFSGYQFDANGAPIPNSITRLTTLNRILPEFASHFELSAPPNAELTWRTY